MLIVRWHQSRANQDGESCRARPTPSCRGCKRASGMKRTQRRWPNWSTRSSGNPLPETGSDGTTSSSDGQNFRTGGKRRAPGISTRSMEAVRAGRFIPISPTVRALQHQVVNVGVRDSTYVLDGLLYHGRTYFRIEEALHRHSGLYRSCLRPDAPTGLRFTTYPRL